VIASLAVGRCFRALAVLVCGLVAGLSAQTSDPAGAGDRGATELPDRVVVASKTFTESRVLGHMMASLIEQYVSDEGLDVRVERKMGLGGTQLVFSALKVGEVDLYAEYTGTGFKIILKETGAIPNPMRVYFRVEREFERRFGLRWLQPFGLDNTYSICVREPVAERLGLKTLSDLASKGGELSAAFSPEFLEREDGWPGMRDAYGMELGAVRSMEHGLAYAAISRDEIDVMDAYATDGKLVDYPLVQLVDDRGFFPPYQAAPLVRQDLLDALPGIEQVLNRLAFRLPDDVIRSLNHRVESGEDFRAVAESFLREEGLLAGGAGVDIDAGRTGRAGGLIGVFRAQSGNLLRQTIRHIWLTLFAVALATLVAVPVGIWVTGQPAVRQVVLGAAGILQTIPSLALLAFMIPIPGLGIGVQSAIAALFLYAILPILRNTVTGIEEVDRELVEAGRGMGLRDRQILLLVQLPLAVPTIMAGVRTSTVIGIGVATLAAFIGAGGLGEPIVTGLQLNDTNLILSGALPAAALALVADFALARVERLVAPRIGSDARAA
jgi:osmoprotectant transport system permease protein